MSLKSGEEMSRCWCATTRGETCPGAELSSLFACLQRQHCRLVRNVGLYRQQYLQWSEQWDNFLIRWPVLSKSIKLKTPNVESGTGVSTMQMVWTTRNRV